MANYLVELRRRREGLLAPVTQNDSSVAVDSGLLVGLGPAAEDPAQAVIRRVLARLNAEGEGLSPEEQRAFVRALVVQESDGMPRGAMEGVQQELSATIGGGLGPLQILMEDPSITEVMVNGPHQVYVERAGKLERTDIRFRDDRSVQALVERIVLPLGRQFNIRNPMVDARLPDGSRVNAVRPPISLLGTTLNIRRFPRAYSLLELIEAGAFGSGARWTDRIDGPVYPSTAGPASILAWAVRQGLNLMISGGTSSGKTTLLGALTEFIPPDERVVFIEDSAELQPRLPHALRLEARRANAEGVGAVPIRSLVVNALRQRPDRIVIGEVRDLEVLDLLQALNTGHRGSLTTIHANSTRHVFLRLVQMATLRASDAGAVARRTVVESAACAVHLIVHTARRSGGRVVESITAVDGVDDHGEPRCTELFCRQGSDFVPTGRTPGWVGPDGHLEVSV